ncbi:hypothetical protein LPJ73_000721 [Coemansia sp. RSA 2703]|nr:hypothetical protein LPJ73_000721 [Coemansia sp. RSA 2703]
MSLFIAIPLLISVTNAALCGCAKDIALKITNIYENGDTDFHYDYCENLGDGRGFTAGIAGFCSGTGDGWDVIQEYHRLTGGNDDFSSMDSNLQKYADSSSDSTSGIENYCKVWENLGKNDANFRKAQDTIRDKLYVAPAADYANQLGLKFSITQGQLYDTGIEHGTGTDADGLGSLIKNTNAKFTADDTTDNSGSTLTINGHQVDEITWLKKFLEVRTEDLKNPKEKDNQGGNYWAQTTYRIESYQYALEQKEYTWTSTVKLLDNDGNPTTSSVQAALCGCAKEISLKVTNIYENGDTEFHYEYCEYLNDGRGYTAGVGGFCTGTSDAWKVIKLYHQLTGGSDAFSPMDATLEKYSQSENDNTAGLEDYCKVWASLANDDKFRKAQDTIRDNLYLTPSQEYAEQLGLQLSISKGQMYDAGLEHGVTGDRDTLDMLIQETNESITGDMTGDSGSTLTINGYKVDEIAWLTEFLKVRANDLKNPKESYNGAEGYWAQSVYRIESYQYAIEQKQYKWTSSAKFLDNDGSPVTVSCDTSLKKRARRMARRSTFAHPNVSVI